MEKVKKGNQMSLFKKQFNIPLSGCIPSPLDKRDVLTSEIDPEIKRFPKICPPPFDLTVLKQEGPSCVGFSGASIKQEKEFRERNSVIFDGLWLYKKCKEIDNYSGPGTYLRILLKVLQKFGAKPLGASESEAEKYKIGGYARVDDLSFEGLKKEIFVHGALLAGFTGSNAGWKSAYIRLPRTGERKWGHATNLPAYRENYLDGQNSWGREWGGHKGLFYVPRNYLPFEAWVILTDLPSQFLTPSIQQGYVAREYLRTNKYLLNQEVYPVVGLVLRKTPAGEKILTLQKGQKCMVIGEAIKKGNYNWIKVRIK
ncbi:MAG: hypothetical protein ACKKMS_00195 [Candidatus Nealsonbacteria bacterium]